MKKTPTKKTVEKSKTPKMEATPPVAELPKPIVTPSMEPWPPDLLEEAALAEPNYHDIGQYRSTISILRNKGFSFREIANWLSDHNVETDHNTVYRVYSKGLTDEEQERLAEEESDEERFRNG